MFADNWKISLRQVRRLLILDIFGLSSLMLPGILSSLTGADGIFCLVLGAAGGWAFLWLIRKNLQNAQGDYYHYMKDTAGQIAGDAFMVFYYLYFVTLCGFVLYQAATLVLTWLLPEGSYFWVSILLLLLAAYGTVRGIEGRARVYEIIYWFLGIPLLVMLFLALREVRTDYWAPLMYSKSGDFLQGTLACWVFLLPLTAVLFLKPFCQKPEGLAGCGKCALFEVTVLNAAIYLILLGVFGRNTLRVLKRPVITLMSMINLPGGFFTRQDVIMTSVWFLALFALMHTGVFQSTLILKELFHESGNRYSMWISLILAFIISMGFFGNTFLMEVYEIYQKWIVLPGLTGILLILLLAYRIRRRAGIEKEGEENEQ
ncbi:MAG: GerAB/ArcD/ProY family transporter [Lachnospiraceae bacterium]|nr:GerAB/ArcD/ProY family transporter [Lachnospiraceae bacterium]